jgi:hypothetical protein
MTGTGYDKETQPSRGTGQEDLLLYDISLLKDDDIYLFKEGTHLRLYEKLGAHPLTVEGEDGTYFAVWAPDAKRVFVTRRIRVSGRVSSGI